MRNARQPAVNLLSVFLGIELLLVAAAQLFGKDCKECQDEPGCDCDTCKAVSCWTWWDAGYHCYAINPPSCFGWSTGRYYVNDGNYDDSCLPTSQNIWRYDGISCGPFECSSCIAPANSGTAYYEAYCGQGAIYDACCYKYICESSSE
jgi:hypothetical protein